MWTTEAIDGMTETVIARLLVEGASARDVAVELACHLADSGETLPALALALPFSLAAAAIDEMLGAGETAHAAAFDAWRMAAMIGAEALALRASGDDGIQALWDLWRSEREGR